MKKLIVAFTLMLVAGVAAAEDGFVSKFDGKSMDGWSIQVQNKAPGEDPDRIFQIHDGMVHAYKDHPDGTPGDMAMFLSDATYGAFHLRLEYRWGGKKHHPEGDKPRNAGVLYHLTRQLDEVWPPMLEFQLAETKAGSVVALPTHRADTRMNAEGVYDPKGTPVAVGVQKEDGSYRLVMVVRAPAEEKADDWNRVDLIVAGDRSLHVLNGTPTGRFWNCRNETPGEPAASLARGHIALQAEYAEILYRKIEIKEMQVADAAALIESLAPAEAPETPRFVKQVIDPTFRAEGVAVADVNQDGLLDILSGELWYEAPKWTPHEVVTPGTYDGATGYALAFFTFAHDMNGDGWVDSVSATMTDGPVRWYENPQNQPGHWKEHVSNRTNWGEAPTFAVLGLDTGLAFVSTIKEGNRMMWAAVPEGCTGDWTTHFISGPEDKANGNFRHGLGIADLNGDGRLDVMSCGGWWAAPVDRTQSPWPFHAMETTPERCANIEIADIDGDGDLDFMTAAAHTYGVWYYEQTGIEDGAPVFQRHDLDDSFSQVHAVRLADIDGDGDPDLIAGKRFWAHNNTDTDPGAKDPAVLYWYETRRTAAGKAAFVRHPIDDNSGVGLQIVVEDMDKNGKPDIVVSNKKGVHLFTQ